MIERPPSIPACFSAYPVLHCTWGEAPFSQEWVFVTVNLTCVSSHAARQAFTEQKMQARFRSAALATLPLPARRSIESQPDMWEVHHIIPLFLSGTNFSLALTPRNIHRWIHGKIDSSTRGMVAGETRPVIIPYRTGAVWTNDAAALNIAYEHFENAIPPSKKRLPVLDRIACSV